MKADLVEAQRLEADAEALALEPATPAAEAAQARQTAADAGFARQRLQVQVDRLTTAHAAAVARVQREQAEARRQASSPSATRLSPARPENFRFLPTSSRR